MQIVKFKNGKYGIRKGIFFYLYKDLRASGVYWWPRGSKYFKDCFADESTVREIFERCTDVGTPIK